MSADNEFPWDSGAGPAVPHTDNSSIVKHGLISRELSELSGEFQVNTQSTLVGIAPIMLLAGDKSRYAIIVQNTGGADGEIWFGNGGSAGRGELFMAGQGQPLNFNFRQHGGLVQLPLWANEIGLGNTTFSVIEILAT